MSSESHHHVQPQTLADLIMKDRKISAAKCYQCGKCTAGCPVALDMDYPPSVIMRMLQAGLPEYEEKILRSYTIWLCLTCEMCFSRCPMEIDIPGIMDYLREESLSLSKTNPKAKNIIAFHKAFLDTVQYTGRLFEVGMYADYKLRSMKIMQDMALMPDTIMKGKLHFIPEMVKERKKMDNIFKRTFKKKEDEQ
jgi:heterodisulfide reductase subunit C2